MQSRQSWHYLSLKSKTNKKSAGHFCVLLRDCARGDWLVPPMVEPALLASSLWPLTHCLCTEVTLSIPWEGFQSWPSQTLWNCEIPWGYEDSLCSDTKCSDVLTDWQLKVQVRTRLTLHLCSCAMTDPLIVDKIIAVNTNILVAIKLLCHVHS